LLCEWPIKYDDWFTYELTKKVILLYPFVTGTWLFAGLFVSVICKGIKTSIQIRAVASMTVIPKWYWLGERKLN